MQESLRVARTSAARGNPAGCWWRWTVAETSCLSAAGNCRSAYSNGKYHWKINHQLPSAFVDVSLDSLRFCKIPWHILTESYGSDWIRCHHAMLVIGFNESGPSWVEEDNLLESGHLNQPAKIIRVNFEVVSPLGQFNPFVCWFAVDG